MSAAVTPDGEVSPFELPGGRVVTGIHVGAYESLATSDRQLTEWAAAEGHSLAAHMWESYLTDPRAALDPAHVADHDHVAARLTSDAITQVTSRVRKRP